MTKLYSPPEGFIDLPFTWAFDGSSLTNGSNALNQNVYLLGGYGDFILRRVVGLDRVLAAGAGSYWLKDRNNKPWQSSPVIVDGSEDLMIVPELKYPETGLIRFDLYDIDLASPGPQIAFQGVRRVRGTPPNRGKVNPKSFTYIMLADFANSGGGIVTGRVKVDDYPFLLEQVMVFKALYAQTTFGPGIDGAPAGTATLQFVATQLGLSGNSITVTLDASNPNQALSVAVSGTSIVITVETGAAGQIISGAIDLLIAYARNPNAGQLAGLYFDAAESALKLPIGVASTNTKALSGGTSAVQITSPLVAMSIYDQDKVKISNIPVLDIFYDGSPNGELDNGAIVTPLYYQKDSQIQIDFTPLVNLFGVHGPHHALGGPGGPLRDPVPPTPPSGILVYLVGKQIYPCE